MALRELNVRILIESDESNIDRTEQAVIQRLKQSCTYLKDCAIVMGLYRGFDDPRLVGFDITGDPHTPLKDLMAQIDEAIEKEK